MRASRYEKHISGAERLLCFSELEDAASRMLARALDHPRGQAKKIKLSLLPVTPSTIKSGPLLDLSTLRVDNWQEGRQRACALLVATGVAPGVADQALEQLAKGPALDGGVMRGAMLVNAITGERLESDRVRGVRVSRMDIDPSKRLKIETFLEHKSLHNSRIIEAWVLASKVAFYPEIIAELCWSDDPDYVTGYVASAHNGYQRITHLKQAGDEIGGRIFFLRPGVDLDPLVEQLQYEPILFGPPASGCF